MGAIFSGLAIAPIIAGGFGSIIYMLIKVIVHMRSNPTPWAIRTAPFFFLIAGTVCTLSIVYKGSPNLGLDKRSPSFIAAVSLGVGGGLFLLSAIFFVPFLHRKVVMRDANLRWYHIFIGPALLRLGEPAESDRAVVPNYAVVQHESPVEDLKTPHHKEVAVDSDSEADQMTYKERMAAGRERFHDTLRQKKGALGWAMRYLHENQIGSGEIYERKNMVAAIKRVPAMVVVAALYGVNYDIHAMQSGIAGTPEAARMARVYSHATKYPNESEYTYSFVSRD